MDKLPQYVLKTKRLSKTKTVIVFRKNFLNKDSFTLENNAWVYNENFKLYGSPGSLKLTIHDLDFNNVFSVNFKSLKANGSTSSFGIFIRVPNQKLPINAHSRLGCLEYHLTYAGKRIPHDNGKGLKATREQNEGKWVGQSLKRTTSVDIPNSVSWRVTHPLQGGKVSPK